MAGALTNIGYHVSEKKLSWGKDVDVFDLGACKIARSLQARLAGSHGF